MRCISSLLIAVFVAVLLPHRSALAADASPAPMPVWPATPPDGLPNPAPEKWDQSKPGAARPFRRVTNVSVPTLQVFRPPADKDTGVSVIVCPGGGYRVLMMDYEGEDVARWLNTIGVTGIVLKYRVPAPQGLPGHVLALQDAQRAVSLVRSKAVDWKLDPQRIGMLGFSAGAHLTAATAARFEERTYTPIDAVDQVSCRPDFAIVIYPGGIIDKETGQIADVVRPLPNTPPTFIAQAHDDRVNSENSVVFYLALRRAGIPAELHIYALGGHGFGLRPSTQPASTWPQRCAEWMKGQGILK